MDTLRLLKSELEKPEYKGNRKNILDVLKCKPELNKNPVFMIYARSVIDIIPGLKLKETDTVYRTKCLKATLDNIEPNLQLDDNVIIEAQPPTKNKKSSEIEHQLEMYYADYELVSMDPREKNKIWFDVTLHHGLFIAKYNDQYNANKEHSKANFLYFIKEYVKYLDTEENNILWMVNDTSNHNQRDLADSFMQLYAFLMR